MSKGFYRDIVKCFPAIEHAFSYGSGVFKQPGLYLNHDNKAAKPMVDFVFAVRDPISWHRNNIARNPSHYSFLSAFGPSAIDWTSRHIGAGVYYNTLVDFGAQVIKYGVVDVDTLKQDLKNWNSLYLSGRLHKPVNTFITSRTVMESQEENLESAFNAALLLTSAKAFSVPELLRIICSLSYLGDIRLGFAEDSKKVERIVHGSLPELMAMYEGHLERALSRDQIKVLGPPKNSISSRSVFKRSLTYSDRVALYASLPSNVLATMTRLRRGDKLPRIPRYLIESTSDESRIKLGHHLASSPFGELALQRALARIVRTSSMQQTCCGILSGGPVKSITYVARKIAKYMISRN